LTLPSTSTLRSVESGRHTAKHRLVIEPGRNNMRISILDKTILKIQSEKPVASNYKLTSRQWNKLFSKEIQEHVTPTSAETASFACIKGTVSMPLTLEGKFALGRAFLESDPVLERIKTIIESNWPNHFRDVEKEVASWLNPAELSKPKPLADSRKYTLPCGHKSYHLDAGPRGVLVCYTVGCGKSWWMKTDKNGKVKLIPKA